MPQIHHNLTAGSGSGHKTWQIVGISHRFAVEFEYHIAGFYARLVGRLPLLDATDQRAIGLAQTERFGQFAGHFLYRDADAPACHAALGAQLFHHLACNIDRYGKRQPHRAARTGVDLRVDANHFTVHVEQRSAGIAGIDRHIGLNERYKIILRQRAAFCTDDAGGDAAVKAERRADCNDPFAHFEFVRIAHGHLRQIGSINLEQGHISPFVSAYHFCLEFALVRQTHGDFIGMVNHMSIGHDVAIRTQDKT